MLSLNCKISFDAENKYVYTPSILASSFQSKFYFTGKCNSFNCVSMYAMSVCLPQPLTQLQGPFAERSTSLSRNRVGGPDWCQTHPQGLEEPGFLPACRVC